MGASGGGDALHPEHFIGNVLVVTLYSARFHVVRIVYGVLQDVTSGGTQQRAREISLQHFLQLHVDLLLSQKKKFS